MTDDEALARATHAASAWGGTRTPPRLIRNRENAVFEVTFADQTRAALRVHRKGYQSRGAIETELDWTTALAARGFPCPQPIETLDGALTVALDDKQIVSAVSWIDAAPIGESRVPFKGSAGEQTALYTRVGATIAQLHAVTDTLDLPDPQRPAWDAEGLLGKTPLWGPFWQNPALTLAEAAFVQSSRKIAAGHLAALALPQSGLIHADLLQENILRDARHLYIIDFDDSGTGYRAYDLATALIQHCEAPGLPDLTAALIGGYTQDQDAVAELHALMPLFMMLRAFASMGWTIGRVDNIATHRLYVDRALRCARSYRATRTPPR